ncbi:MAG: hypothetical protein LBD73_01775 [Deferribacteraceae bacterium]|nr:hypothetical protein [Deferribacteraceae bacterium]
MSREKAEADKIEFVRWYIFKRKERRIKVCDNTSESSVKVCAATSQGLHLDREISCVILQDLYSLFF